MQIFRRAGEPNPNEADELRRLKAEIEGLRMSHSATQEQMRALDSVKTDFVTIASHELRTPLAQIRGYADILDALYEQDILDSDSLGDAIQNIRKAAERMDDLIAAMLDVSQLDVNAMNLNIAEIALEDVMRMAIEPLTEGVRGRKIALTARGLKGLPPLEADSQRLVQALRNIIVNAIKFTPDAGRIEINAHLQPAASPVDKDFVLIAFTDTGVGIKPEHLELIFHKFFRGYDPSLHSSGAYSFMGAGPGLGLTIAKGVIEGHGGEIWAESSGHSTERLPGATLYVLLPVKRPVTATRVQPLESVPQDATRPHPLRRRV